MKIIVTKIKIINLFKSIDLNYGPSKEVLATLKEYTKISKERKGRCSIY